MNPPFAKGALYPSEATLFRDSATGAPSWQLTNHPSINHATYFLQCSFSADGQQLLFISNRSGAWNLFAVEGFPGGPIRQLTHGPAIHPFSPAFHPDGQQILFVRQGGVWALDRTTLHERCITQFPGASVGECSLDASGQWLVAAIKQHGANGLAVGRVDGTNWQVLPYPRTVIHPQFHPVDPNWILFAGDPAPRMHRIRRDGTHLECLHHHDNDEFVVHETFLGQTGDIVYTVWPFRLASLQWEALAGAPRLHRTIVETNAWHITPNRSGTKVLFDTNHPDRGICLAAVATGQIVQVCAPQASGAGTQWRTSRYALAEDFAAARSSAKDAKVLSWMEAGADTVYGPQWTHPHPSFSRDETSVVYTSDRTGSAQVYVSQLPPAALAL